MLPIRLDEYCLRLTRMCACNWSSGKAGYRLCTSFAISNIRAEISRFDMDPP